MAEMAYISKYMRNGVFTVHTTACATVRGRAYVEEITLAQALDHVTMVGPTCYRHCLRCRKLDKISDLRARVEREAQPDFTPRVREVETVPEPERPEPRKVVITGAARSALNMVIVQALYADTETGELYLKRLDEWIKVSGLGADASYAYLNTGVMALWLHNVLTLIETPYGGSLRRLCLSGPIEAITE